MTTRYVPHSPLWTWVSATPEALITPYEIPEEYERLPPTEGPTVAILNLTEEVGANLTDKQVAFYEDICRTIEWLLSEGVDVTVRLPAPKREERE